ncbi:hypothetical protein DPMN_165952 [Dreissena polymorpha]|uniref:C17orf113 probable zinc finger domain-containing protein n=1 Tax=Dreissena polymorpha TaxID=45954 RepID=A0A9D4EXU2_DREPO|nr:hypothetical protein DPMN_165952 [Dreissena polymorpha]
MKRISEYFAPTAATKKPKTQVEPPPNNDNSPQPSNELKTAPETSTDSDKKRGFQRIWLTNERFKSWLSYDKKENQMKCTLCVSTGKINPFVSGCSNFRTSTLDRHGKLLAHGKEEIQILCEKYGQQGSQCVPYVDEAEVKMKWEILKHLVIQQKYSTDNIYTLWKILHTHHKNFVPKYVETG